MPRFQSPLKKLLWGDKDDVEEEWEMQDAKF